MITVHFAENYYYFSRCDVTPIFERGRIDLN